jgi:catechol 2,3-dioxygenase-like lactoylglutathione lyase family enzyme
MPKITHIALKVNGLDALEKFYEEVFGFKSVGRSRSEDRSRAAVTDGDINLTFLKYDSEDADMAKAVGDGPAIHHFAIEVDDVAKYVPLLEQYGCELLSPPTAIPVKFRMPGGGPIAELLPEGAFKGGVDRRAR